MKNRHLVPKNKEDVDFIVNLESKSIDEIREAVPELLEWLQDINWPQVPLITNYLIPYINEIEDDLIRILKGNDEFWKYTLLHCLIASSTTTPSDRILLEIERISIKPIKNEDEEEVIIRAKEILNKFSK